MSYLNDSISALKHFEGSVPWMYLDTVGKVTVGVGKMIPTTADAKKLPFQSNNAPATPQEISVDFQRVLTMAKGKLASFYRSPISVLLTEASINSLLLATITDFEVNLRKRLSAYSTFPEPAKLALIDMAYNLGIAGLFSEYPTLIKAVESLDWATAAGQCHRRGPSEERNNWTRDHFLTAAQTAPKPTSSPADIHEIKAESAEETSVPQKTASKKLSTRSTKKLPAKSAK